MLLLSSVRRTTTRALCQARILDRCNPQQHLRTLYISTIKLNMDFEKIKEGLEKKSFILLDVRAKEEWDQERIPGAKHLPVSEVQSGLNLDSSPFESKYGFPKPDKSDNLVTHCKMGGRAGKAAEALKEMGFTAVQVYSGSMKDWKANGGPLEGQGENK